MYLIIVTSLSVIWALAFDVSMRFAAKRLLQLQNIMCSCPRLDLVCQVSSAISGSEHYRSLMQL